MADSNKNVDYTITADAAGFASAMDKAASSASRSADTIKSQFDQVGKAFEHVQGKMLMLAAVVGGGKFFKDAIADANKLTGETMALGKRLGLTGDDASALNTALGDIGSDSETYIGAFEKFAKQLKTNEDGLQAMGLQTRDANGHLRDSKTLFQEALQTVGEYRPGLDQTTAAMTLFGKGVDDAMKLQKLNNQLLEDAKAKNEELGFTVSQEGVAASKAYKAAMNDVGDVLTAVNNVVGQAVMPVFTELANYFASTGPYVINVFKGALTGLLVVFEYVKGAVKAVANVIFETLNFWMDAIPKLGEIIVKVIKGDYSGAAQAGKELGARIGQAFTNGFSEFVETGNSVDRAVQGHLQRVWGKGTPVAAPKGGGKTMGEFKPGSTAAAKEDKDKTPNAMPFYEEMLAQERELATQRDAIHGMSKEAELKFWSDILATAKLTGDEETAVAKKVSQARIELLKHEALQAQEIGKIALGQWQEQELGKVEIDAETARQRQAMGEITQQQLLQQELVFEDRKHQIRMTAAQSALQMLDPQKDPVQVAQLNAQLEGMELQHQQRMLQIRGQIAQQTKRESDAFWTDITGRASRLWDQGIQAMMNGTLTWRNAMKAVGTEVIGWFASSVVKPMVMQWLFGEQAKTGATAAGTAQRWVLESMAAAKSAAIWAATAIKNIMTSAWSAMAAAWSAMVGIPVVGPALGVAAAAAAFAGVASIAGRVASAEGGYDIPAGVNPMTQLHEREMVLPARHADVIRAMADGGGAGGPAIGGHTIHYNDHSGRLSADEIRSNVKVIARELARLDRNFFKPA